MSATHRRAHPKNSSRMKIDNDRLNDLFSRLQQLVLELGTRRACTNKAFASNLLQETCDYISYLQREVDNLSGQLLQLLDSADVNNDQAAIIRDCVT